jgi:transposase-like protein
MSFAKRKKSSGQVTKMTSREQVSEEKKLQELMAFLDELEKQGKLVDIQVCPHCKSVNLRRIGTMQGDMSGQMAMTLPKYECLNCGWRGRLTLYATNRPFDKKTVAVVENSKLTKES